MLQQGTWEAAEGYLRTSAARAPQPIEVYSDLAQALQHTGKREEAARLLDEYQSNFARRSTYESGLKELIAGVAAEPRDRARRYAVIRFCLQNRQPMAAQTAVLEAAQELGWDDILRHLSTEAQRQGAAPLPDTAGGA